jgi:hypothetical protein
MRQLLVLALEEVEEVQAQQVALILLLLVVLVVQDYLVRLAGLLFFMLVAVAVHQKQDKEQVVLAVAVLVE